MTYAGFAGATRPRLPASDRARSGQRCARSDPSPDAGPAAARGRSDRCTAVVVEHQHRAPASASMNAIRSAG